MDNLRRRWAVPVLLVLAVACSAGIFQWQFLRDNKYTAPRPQGANGTVWLEDSAAWADPGLLLHLVDGWEVYGDRLLTPEEINFETADQTLYLGQYIGLNFGDRGRPVYGDATYRLTLHTDGAARTYALELPEIYSAYRLWINGRELAGMGEVGETYRPEIGGGLLAFEAGDRIEIVVQVSDRDGYYSGMIYPPAFGTPAAVGRVLNGRILTHGVAWTAALLLGLFALLPWQGWQNGGRRQFLLALFCLCFILYTGYPLFHGWGLTSHLWYGVERMSRQLMTVCLLLLTGELCGVPKRAVYLAACAGLLVALMLLQPQVLPGWENGGFYMVSAILRWWHRIASLLLVAFGGWGLWKRRVASAGLLAGAMIFACATVMDQVHRLYEPIRTGFYAETAGFLILLILAGTLRREAWEDLRERLVMRERLDVQRQAAEAERQYLEQVHTMRHEIQGQLGLIAGYLDEEKTDAAREYLAKLRQEADAGVQPVRYTGYRPIDDILSVRLAQARRMGARVECSATAIEESPGVSDEDLARVLLNILGNALEALERVEEQERRLTLRLVRQGGVLSISCTNTCARLPEQREGRLLSTKQERGHGLGLSLIREVADKYRGRVILTPELPRFHIQVLLHVEEDSR